MNIDYETGEIVFSSQNSDNRIQVDYYQVIISDVTQEIFHNDSYISNHTLISGLFQGSVCLPYIVTVQAHNSFGFSENSVIISPPVEPDGESSINIIMYLQGIYK